MLACPNVLDLQSAKGDCSCRNPQYSHRSPARSRTHCRSGPSILRSDQEANFRRTPAQRTDRN
jgi:hypothetical protein